MNRVLLFAATAAALTACAPADEGKVRADTAAMRFGPSAAEVLAAEKHEYDYCLEKAQRHPDRVTCASAPDQVQDVTCKPGESRGFATCSYSVSYADGKNLPSPDQIYEKVGDHWELRSVFRMAD